MPSTTDARRLCSGRAWVLATTPYRLACQLNQQPCALCGQTIDYSLHRNHKRAFTIDHVIPLWTGQNPDPLDPRGWQPAHRSCNSSRGAREHNRERSQRRPKPNYYQRTEHTW